MGSKRNIFFDAFGVPHVVKRFIVFVLGSISYRRYNGFNKLKIKGTENIASLPDRNVLFVSNHQTYFADVSAMYHVFSSVKNGFENSIHNPIYLLNPKIDMYYVAAKETMKKGLLTRLFSLAGAVTVKRTWREAGKSIKRKVDLNEIGNIEKALDQGWVITFPQGTTTAFAPGRKGTAHIIKNQKPIVIPVVIDGFRRSFDKKGLLIKKKGVEQSMTFKPTMKIDYENDSPLDIINNIMDEIEQSEKFIKVKPLEVNETETSQN